MVVPDSSRKKKIKLTGITSRANNTRVDEMELVKGSLRMIASLLPKR